VALNYYNATNSVSHSTRSWEAAKWGYQQLRVLHGRGFSSCTHTHASVDNDEVTWWRWYTRTETTTMNTK